MLVLGILLWFISSRNVASILITLTIVIYYFYCHWRDRITHQRTYGKPLVFGKNLYHALLFSVDILIPFVDLDKENLDFIIDAAENYQNKQWIYVYFLTQKLVGPVVISILLPIIFSTSL